MKKLLTLLAFVLVAFTVDAQSCPDTNHPHMIDLGLPSGTKWACCNVGASKPEEKGGYYAWGETEEKSVYSDVTYQYCTGVDENGNGWYDDFHDETDEYGVYQNIGSDIAGTQYDVAHVQWGGSWVMPSLNQIDELLNNCSRQMMWMNDFYGQCFTGPSGGSIFLPLAGFYNNDHVAYAGSDGYYWSSTQNPSKPGYAYSLFFSTFSPLYVWSTGHSRYIGLPIRPVSTNEITKGDMNGDGEISIRDVLYTVNIIIGAKELIEQDIIVGDFDGDGELTIRDVMQIVVIILDYDHSQSYH